jgi:hypothetical protein
MSLFRDPLTKALADVAESIMEGKVMCEACGKMHAEGACSMNESIQNVAKELEAYAKANGGIDKKDMMKAADMMKANKMKDLVKFVNGLDTEPRDLIIMMVANNLGTKTAEKLFKVNIRSSKMYEDIELPEEITDEDAGDFVVAAAAAKKAGKKKFSFGGKEYPVTIKTDIKTEEVELDEAVVIDYDGGLDADDPDLKKLLKQLRAKIKVTGTDPNGFDEVKFTFPNDAAVKKFIKTTGIDILDENLDEAMKITHVVIDTADDDKVVSMASDEKGAKSSIVSAERPPMSIKDKKTLKVVKLKKPAGQKAADKLIGYPLKEEALDEEKVECPKCKGEGCDHCDGKGYHEKMDEKTNVKSLAKEFEKRITKNNALASDRVQEKERHAILKLAVQSGVDTKALDKAIIDVMNRLDEEVELNEANYEIKHKTFSSAIQHAVEVAAKKGYEVDPDDYDRKVAMGPKKPSKGKTNSYSIKLTKNGKEQRKALQVQIANLDDKFYELNMYIQ